MEEQHFIKNFSSQFDETDVSAFSMETNFRDIEEWSSLVALTVVAMFDEEYSVKLTGEDIKQATTLRDLFLIVQSRILK